MRLTSRQHDKILQTAVRVIGTQAAVWLFGSRADDSQRGGDIDLLIETDAIVPNRAQMLCRLQGALTFALGDRKIDILLKDARTPELKIFEIARRTGVRL